MDRRKLLLASLSSLLAYECGCANAQEKETISGCRMLTPGNVVIKNRMRSSSGQQSVDQSCLHWHILIAQEFGLLPGFSFIDDGLEPNAFATPEALIPSAPDGTVLLGTALVKHEVGEIAKADDGPPEDKNSARVFPSIIVILAHECGHILQYKRGMKPSGPWQMEPHADFLAGWAMARLMPKIVSSIGGEHGAYTAALLEILHDETAIEAMFKRGDTLFNNKEHHGEPEFRAAMVIAGSDSKSLDADAAFEKGKRMAGIRP